MDEFGEIGNEQGSQDTIADRSLNADIAPWIVAHYSTLMRDA
jgi:hypothetical protein